MPRKALAKASLWDTPGLGHILDGMGQIPINHGAGDADALARFPRRPEVEIRFFVPRGGGLQPGKSAAPRS